MTNRIALLAKLARILEDNVLHEVGGYENEMLDGDITEEEYETRMSAETLTHEALYVLKAGYKNGYIKSPNTGETLEAKHLKFLGNDMLNSAAQLTAHNVRQKEGLN